VIGTRSIYITLVRNSVRTRPCSSHVMHVFSVLKICYVFSPFWHVSRSRRLKNVTNVLRVHAVRSVSWMDNPSRAKEMSLTHCLMLYLLTSSLTNGS